MEPDKIDKIKSLGKEIGEEFINKAVDAKLRPSEILTAITMMSCQLVQSLAKTIGVDPKAFLEGYQGAITAYMETALEDEIPEVRPSQEVKPS